MVKLKTSCLAFIGQKGFPKNFPGTSGIEYYVQKHAFALARRGVRVWCYVRPWSQTGQKGAHRNIRVITLPSLNTALFDAVTHTCFSTLHVCFSPCDTVWYQGIGPGFFGFLPRLFGKQVIVTVHALDWKRKKWGTFARISLMVAEYISVLSACRVIAVARHIHRDIKKRYGINSVIDSVHMTRKKLLKPYLIKRIFGLHKEEYVLFLGRFVPEKRIEWLLSAFHHRKRRRLKLVLAGGSSHTDAYERYIKQLSYGDPDIIFPGYVFGQFKEELLANCKVFVLPSSTEGYPVVIEEALSYIRPCILNDTCKDEGFFRKSYIHFFHHDDQKNFCEILQLFMV